MAKRAPILPDNYNPVGDRLRRVLQPAATPLEPNSNIVNHPLHAVEQEEASSPDLALREREQVPDVPVDKELKTTSVRFRCSMSERRKWHTMTQEYSGDHNNLSHFIRATMLLLENADEQLRRLTPDIQRFRKPATTDTLGIALYEQRLAQLLYDAIKTAGRPKA
jgi:hypothetical protein